MRGLPCHHPGAFLYIDIMEIHDTIAAATLQRNRRRNWGWMHKGDLASGQSLQAGFDDRLP